MTYDGSVNSDDINAIISSGRYDSGVVYSARRPADVVATDTVKVLPVSGIEGGTAAVETAAQVDGGATSVAVSGGNLVPLDRVTSGVAAMPEPILTSKPLKNKYTHVFSTGGQKHSTKRNVMMNHAAPVVKHQGARTRIS